MRPQLPLEIPDLRLVSQDIIRARQELQPDRIQLQSPQPKHPLQRTEKFPPPSRYFAANPQPRKIVTRAEWSFCSRAQGPIAIRRSGGAAWPLYRSTPDVVQAAQCTG